MKGQASDDFCSHDRVPYEVKHIIVAYAKIAQKYIKETDLTLGWATHFA